MTQKLVVGNWKMNNDFVAAIHLTQQIGVLARQSDVAGISLVVAPPACDLRSVSSVIEADRLAIRIAAQHAHHEDSGAFTGEISIPMVKRLGCTYVIVGHSERREHFSMSDDQVAATVKSAVRHDVTPIVCVGESSQIRESGNFHEHIENQVHAAVAGLSAANRERVIFAYEPLWAIGTGSAASAEQVAQVAEIIRESTGSGSLPTTVLYGGSVTVENCSSLAQSGGVDGFLVGGASLRAEDFVTIATLAANCYR